MPTATTTRNDDEDEEVNVVVNAVNAVMNGRRAFHQVP
jgi:hypothetical protein